MQRKQQPKATISGSGNAEMFSLSSLLGRQFRCSFQGLQIVPQSQTHTAGVWGAKGLKGYTLYSFHREVTLSS
jgi:hypothetical protein